MVDIQTSFVFRDDKCLLKKEMPSSSHEWKEDESENSENLSMERLVRKDSPINPYNRFEYPSVQWLPLNVNENTVVTISSPERESLLKTQMFSNSFPSEEFLKTENVYLCPTQLDEACSKRDTTQNEIYQKIRHKVEKAVKVIFL